MMKSVSYLYTKMAFERLQCDQLVIHLFFRKMQSQLVQNQPDKNAIVRIIELLININKFRT